MAESYGPIAHQRINQDTSIKLANGESKTLRQGTFVKAIHKRYMPVNHPLEEYDDSFYVAVFSPYGLGLVVRYAVDWNVF
jgi:hypothetical protein